MQEVAFEEGKRLEGACREGGGHSSGGESVCVSPATFTCKEGAGTSFPPSYCDRLTPALPSPFPSGVDDHRFCGRLLEQGDFGELRGGTAQVSASVCASTVWPPPFGRRG